MDSSKYKFVDLFGGEKGGVGKTLVAKVAIQCLIDRDYEFIAVEADRSNPDVSNVYRKYCKHAFFTENEKEAGRADRIFEFATRRSVLVNLPSQVQKALKTWFDNNNLFDLGEQHGVAFRKWFVTNGEYHSIKLFLKSLDDYGEKMPHILVRNFGVCDEWEQVEKDEKVQAAISKYNVQTIDFPKLGYAERYFINKNQLTFGDARGHHDLTIMGRQRVVNFLNSAYAAFDSTGAWQESNDKGELCEPA